MRARLIGLMLALFWGNAGFAFQNDVVPLEYFASYEAVQSVGLSPDGTHIAMMRLPARDGNYIVEIHDVERLGEDPVRLNSDRMEIIQVRWASADYLWFTFREQVRERIDGYNQGVYEYRQAIVHRSGEGGFHALFDDARLVRTLPNEDNIVIMSTADYNHGDDSEGRSYGDLYSPDFYRYNLETRRRNRIMRGNLRFGNFDFDVDGNPRFAEEFDYDRQIQMYFWRANAEESEWSEVFRYDIQNAAEFGITGINLIGFDPLNENYGFVIMNNGRDTVGAYVMDLQSGDIVEPLMVHDQADITQVIYTPDIDLPRYVAAVGVIVDGEDEYAFIDGRTQAIYAMIDEAFPDMDNSVLACTNNCAQMLVYSQSPQEPGVYYLIRDGQPTILAREYPQLIDAALGDEIYFEATARDGIRIPTYVTLPGAGGNGPHPAVIMPHGGPWASDHPGYDEWAAVLSNRGYVVIRPQYRGGTDFGLEHWMAGFGQWGLTMQDDLDDSVAGLVAEGLVDPDRVAMFGWSYGGYTSLVAAIRNENVYQCAIAGAAVSDLDRIRRETRRSPILRDLQLRAFAGVSPTEHADDVRKPLLIIQGDVDQRVPPYHAEAMIRALNRNNVPHRFVELEGADHFSNTLDYNHQLTLYTELTSWLANECGMPTVQNPAR